MNLLDEQFPEFKDLPFASLMMGYDMEGKERPLAPYVMVGGEEVRVKAVQDAANPQKFYDYYLNKSGVWEPVPQTDEPQQLFVRGIGSSEVRDCDGDIMHKSALESMCRVDPGLLTYLDHHQGDDEYLFGSLVESPKLTYREAGAGDGPLIKAAKAYAAVEICSDVEPESPRAMKRYRYMKKGRRYGWSVGCYYTKYEKRIEKGRTVGADVYEVAVVEWSVVPMPNNQQSWVEATHKAFVRKGILKDESLDSAENVYRLSHFDDFPDTVAYRLKNLQEYLGTRGLCLATTDPALAGRATRS